MSLRKFGRWVKAVAIMVLVFPVLLIAAIGAYVCHIEDKDE